MKASERRTLYQQTQQAIADLAAEPDAWAGLEVRTRRALTTAMAGLGRASRTATREAMEERGNA